MVKIEIRDTDNSQVGVLQVSSVSNFPLALNEKISDITDPAKRAASHSLTFKIPGTDENNQTLKQLYDANILDANSIFSKKPIRIVINGIQYKNYNFLKLKKSTHINGIPDTFDCVIFGENMAWVVELKEKFLCDIDWLFNGTTTFKYSRENCEETWIEFINDPDNYDFVMCPINYGQWQHHDYVHVNDLRPQLRVLAVVEKGLESIGYTLNSTFLNSSEFKNKIMTYFGELWKLDESRRVAKFIRVRANDATGEWETRTPTMTNRILSKAFLKSSANGNYSDVTDPDDLVEITRTFRVPFSFEQTDGLDNWDGANNQSRSGPTIEMGNVQIFIINTGLCVQTPASFKMTGGPISHPAASGSAIHTLQAFVSIWNENLVTGTIKRLALYNQSFISTATPTFGGSGFVTADNCVSFEPIFDTGFVDVAGSEEIVYATLSYTFQIKKKIIDNSDFRTSDARFVFDSLSLEIAGSDKLAQDETIDDIKDKFPCDASIMDVLQGVSTPFNLYFKTDLISKTVFIEPRDDFYSANTAAKDWSNKLDISTKYTLENLSNLPREWIWRWKDDGSDAWLTWFKEQHDGDHLGQFTLELDDKFVANKTKILSSTFFGTAWSIDDIPISLNEDLPVYIAAMWGDLGGEAEYSNDFVPRLLNYQYDSQVVMSDAGVFGFSQMGWYRSNIFLTIFPQAFAVALHSDRGENLYYHDVSVEAFAPFVKQGLFNLHWNKTMNIIKLGRVLSGKFFLKDTDMQAIDLRVPIYLSKPPELFGYWIIDRVANFKPAKELPTTCKLVKRLEVDSLTNDPEEIIIEMPAPNGGGFGVAGGVNDTYFEG